MRDWPLPNEAQTCALAEVLLRETGVCLGHDRAQWMRDRLESLFSRAGLDDWQQVLRRVDQDSGFRHEVIELLLTQETRWFRDQALFSHLPSLLRGQGEDRVIGQRLGFLGCATGQEVYSTLITLDQAGLLGDGVQSPVLALDVSQRAVQVARRGCYSLAQMQRGMSQALLARYFQRSGDECCISPNLRQWVEFRQGSLLNLGAIGRFDVLFCRNVLVYFSPELRAITQQRLLEHLNPGAILVLGASEQPVGLVSDCLERVVLGASHVYRYLP